MADHPYADLPASAYWRAGVAELNGAPTPDYCTPKWAITRQDRIATAGSCFAQHLGRHLKRAGFNVLDAEPAPKLLPETLHMEHGYGIYSGRYGNVYTARQMLQLAHEALGKRPMSTEVWGKDGRYVDALRPTIDPVGHGTLQAVRAHRRAHLAKVRELLTTADLMVFTMGLTETWENIETGQVYPVCPGTVAGRFDDSVYRFRNLTFQETLDDMLALRALLHEQNPERPPRMLLTVSPVPLTATASGQHVMQATVYSKSVLRAVAGQLCAMFDDVDYFPSYEIVSSPWAPEHRYAPNMRSVRDESVQLVMRTFMAVHDGADQTATAQPQPAAPVKSAPAPAEMSEADLEMAVKCDEELLDTFGPRTS